MTSAVTAPLERQLRADARPDADVVDQFRRRLGASPCGSRLDRSTWTSPSRRCRPRSTPPSNLLPNDLPTPPVYNKVNPADTPVLTLAITSQDHARCPRSTTWWTRAWRRSSRRCRGVGLVSIAGGQRPAVRIQVNPAALAANGLNLSDVRTAIARGQRQPAQGQLRRPDPRDHARCQRPAALGRGVREPDPRLQGRRAAAARAMSRRSSTAPRTDAWPRGPTNTPAVLLNIQRQPGANVIEVVDRIKALLPQLHRQPAGRPST